MPVLTNDEHVERFEEYASVWSEMWKDTPHSFTIDEQPLFNRWNTDDPSCA